MSTWLPVAWSFHFWRFEFPLPNSPAVSPLCPYLFCSLSFPNGSPSRTQLQFSPGSKNSGLGVLTVLPCLEFSTQNVVGLTSGVKMRPCPHDLHRLWGHLLSYKREWQCPGISQRAHSRWEVGVRTGLEVSQGWSILPGPHNGRPAPPPSDAPFCNPGRVTLALGTRAEVSSVEQLSIHMPSLTESVSVGFSPACENRLRLASSGLCHHPGLPHDWLLGLMASAMVKFSVSAWFSLGAQVPV